MNPDRINRLDADHNPCAFIFFVPAKADEDEQEEWGAHNLDELPLRCDFEESFEPRNPFDEGYRLVAQFPILSEKEEAL